MGNDFIEETIMQGFINEKTEQNKRDYLGEIENLIQELYKELENENE